MMQPKRTKYRKQFKGSNSGAAHRGSTVAFGEYALKATDRGEIKNTAIPPVVRAGPPSPPARLPRRPLDRAACLI